MSKILLSTSSNLGEMHNIFSHNKACHAGGMVGAEKEKNNIMSLSRWK